jgi:hypothetical protein
MRYSEMKAATMEQLVDHHRQLELEMDRVQQVYLKAASIELRQQHDEMRLLRSMIEMKGHQA